jgi:hypothetical protein
MADKAAVQKLVQVYTKHLVLHPVGLANRRDLQKVFN